MARPRHYFSDDSTPLKDIPLARVLPFEVARLLRLAIGITDPAKREASIDHLEAYPHLYRADLGTIGE